MLVVGGAASLQVAPGKILLDSPDFPVEWKAIATAHAQALKVYRTDSELDWTYFSPAAFITPGQRTGKFRLGKEDLLVDGTGQSRISMEDFAVAVVDELEQPQNVRQRMTIGY